MRNLQTTNRKAGSSTAAFEELLIKEQNGRFILSLYVTGMSGRSTAAITNIREVCEQYLAGRFELTVVDIYQQPHLARLEQIVAAPTLIKTQPLPVQRLVGDLSDRARVLRALGLAV